MALPNTSHEWLEWAKLKESAAVAGQVGVVVINPDGSTIASASGAGTQYTDGAASVANPIGTLPVFKNGGTMAAVTNALGLPVNIIAGSLGGAVSPHSTYATSVAVAAGGTSGTNLRSGAITAAKTGKLNQVVISSSVEFRADIQTVLAGVTTTVATLFGGGPNPVIYNAPTGYVTQVAGGAFTGFQVTLTNLDITSSADAFSTFFWDES